MKKVIEGWLGGQYDTLGIFNNKKEADYGMFHDNTLDELMEDFKVKKVRITIEVIEE